MTATRFEIRKYTAEFVIRDARHLDKLKPGCSFDNSDSVLLETHSSEEAARAALEAYEPDIRFFDSYYFGKLALVTEYSVECIAAEFDEDGDETYSELLWVDFSSFPSSIEFAGNEYKYNIRYGWTIV